MATPYNHKAIEQKWRKHWQEHPVNVNDGKKPKYYCLDMFPYPSGSGLHVGHWRGYVISDVWSRYKLLNGYYVIHPMGWDAFGLPAENYAIKMGTHPRISTEANIKNIKRQINEISAIYDWDMEVNTTDPEFYKWTQWIFVKMFKKGLAYEKQMPINWCPSCKTGLANEEVVNGKCERCGADVTKKNLRQWMLKITAYADRLLADLDKLDWPEKVKKMQAEWIGKSHGAEVNFKVDGRDDEITVYTTRPDTLHGATFMVLAPEHELAKDLASLNIREEDVRKCAEKETPKQYSNVDKDKLVKLMISGLENKPLSIKEQIIYEQEYLGNIMYKNPKAPKDMYYVLECKFYKDKTKPYLMLYNMRDGEYLKTKITSGKSFIESPFIAGNVINVKEFGERNKMKKVGGDWIKTDEKERIVKKWDVY